MTHPRLATDNITVSTDDFAGPLQLQTNLALKGILGIKAMSGIAKVIDQAEDTKHFKVGLEYMFTHCAALTKTC